MDEHSTQAIPEAPHSDWQMPMSPHWHGEGSLRRFSVSGWPAILLVGLAAIVLVGPALHMAFFVVKLALTLLPLVIVGGLLLWGVRSVMFTTFGGSRMRRHWHKHHYHDHWQMRHDRGHRKDVDGIFYV